jgi:hypothetical protein
MFTNFKQIKPKLIDVVGFNKTLYFVFFGCKYFIL